jgi:ABC-type antimicrobial peptide transport system permease subunit
VADATLASAPPLSGIGVSSSFDIVGKAKDQANPQQASVTAVGGDYARTLGTPMVRGRMVGDQDTLATPFAADINETLAKKYFAGTDPIGKQINLGGKDTGMIKPYTIVGILGDQVDKHVGSTSLPLILLPQEQIPTTSLFYQALLKTVITFAVKTHGNIPVAAEMRALFHENAPGFALDNFQTMQDAVDQNTFSQRLGLYLVGSFAGLAVAMVFAGLYGVLSQLVSYRKREIGVRMALGANRGNVIRLVLRGAFAQILIGLLIGIPVSIGCSRLIAAQLYQVKGWDPLVLAGSILALGVCAFFASIIPARRAASINPVRALRSE